MVDSKENYIFDLEANEFRYRLQLQDDSNLMIMITYIVDL